MEIQIAVAKINQYDSPESGDTLEVVERPNGGVSVVLSDGLSTGRASKAISTMVVRKTINLLAEGVRDGIAARAASDHLYTEKGGKETAYLNILSADLQTNTLVLVRNNPTPIFIAQDERIECLSSNSGPIGGSRNIRPDILEIPLESGTTVIMYTDGLVKAGAAYQDGLDVCTLLTALMEDQEPGCQQIADTLLTEAIRLDQRQPNDDMSVVVLRVVARNPDTIRRMTVRLPVVSSNTRY